MSIQERMRSQYRPGDEKGGDSFGAGQPTKDASDVEMGSNELLPPAAWKEVDGNQESVDTEDVETTVWWEGTDDPQDPMNLSETWKSATIHLVLVISFVTPFVSTMMAPGVPQVLREFHSDNTELGSFAVSVCLLGFGTGPLLIGPLSEIYGRTPCYHVYNVLFGVATTACAKSSSLSMLIVFRLIEGAAGSGPLTLGGGTIADIIPLHKRGTATAKWSMGLVCGPVLGKSGFRSLLSDRCAYYLFAPKKSRLWRLPGTTPGHSATPFSIQRHDTLLGRWLSDPIYR